jgi:hypothetical protein
VTRCILLARKLTAGNFVTESVVLKQRNDMKRCHPRGIDRTFRAAVDEDIIEKGSNQSTANRAENRRPDPVLAAIIKDCIKGTLETVTERLQVGIAVPFLP